MLEERQALITAQTLKDIERFADMLQEMINPIDNENLVVRINILQAAADNALKTFERGQGPEWRLREAMQADDQPVEQDAADDLEENPVFNQMLEDELRDRPREDQEYAWAMATAAGEERVETGLANLAAALSSFVRAGCRSYEYARAIQIAAEEIRMAAARLEEIDKERRGIMDH